jgi:hypothetical protein
MRTSAITAILALSTLTTTLYASDDFSALLADLSFGDAPSLNQPLSVVKEQPAAQLMPVPTGIVMPEMVESTQPVQSVPVESAPVQSAPVESVQAPQVALQDPVASDPEPSTQVDLEAAFALQDLQTVTTQVPSQTVGYIPSSCHSQDCDSVITCRPHNKAILPSSTLYQYFRSNACNTNVWDGYRQKCCSSHAHTMGECDCFTKSSKGHSCLSKGCNGNDCARCDAGCDR